MASSSPTPPISTSPAPPPSAPPRRGLPPPCWSHDETLALIASYRHKWHSLRRANLRAAHWDEVAADLSRRTSLLPSSTPKTPIQCRHKIEKLRKRFRSDRLRKTSAWPFFPFMESLEHPSQSDDRENENESEGVVMRFGEGGMVDAVRVVGDGFMRMEKVKMDVARETERMRMEMELKRTRMILDSQQQLVDAFVKGFVAGKVKRNKGKFE